MPLSFGRAFLFYPEATAERCTFALALDIDPVRLVRGKGPRDRGLLDQYVSDRPYAASSFLSVAIAKTLRNALGGTSKERPELSEQEIALTATVMPLPVRGDEDLVEQLFAPLGYDIDVRPIPLDPQLTYLGEAWDRSAYVRLTLSARCRLRDLLAHLYVLIPVLDRKKHYFIDRHELDKLIAKGQGWLADHPARQLIARRYFGVKRSWAREALVRLSEDPTIVDEVETPIGTDEAAAAPAAEGDLAATSDESNPVISEPSKDAAEGELEKPIRLHDQRLDTVTAVLVEKGAHRIVDLGCGSGKLLKRLMTEKQFTEIVGVDVSAVSLEIAAKRLRLERMNEKKRKRIKLLHGALTYRDRRVEGFDAAALVEVIEHLDPERLASLERVVFEFAKPDIIVVTTPNREYNAKFESLPAGQLRHADHRFEWTRKEFNTWAAPVAERHGYTVAIRGIGEEDPEFGCPSQIAVFERTEQAQQSAEAGVHTDARKD